MSKEYAEILSIAEKGAITEKKFEDYFKPIVKDEQELQFTRGNWDKLLDLTQELADKQGTQSYQHMWAVVDADGDSMFYLNGRHVCNVVHHVVCEVPWGNGTNDDLSVHIEAEY